MGKNHSKLRIRKDGQKSFTNKSTHKTEGNCSELMKKTEDVDVLSDCSVDDNEEVTRLDEFHFLQKELWDKTIFSAPITKKLEEIRDFRVLDVG